MNRYNPYEPLRQEALARCLYWQKRGITQQAAWFARIATVHAEASNDWIARRRAEIVAARALAAIPVAKLAPPLMAIVLPHQVKKRPSKGIMRHKPR